MWKGTHKKIVRAKTNTNNNGKQYIILYKRKEREQTIEYFSRVLKV